MRDTDIARRRGRNYAAIPNAAMRDEGLSLEARGMLALLMTYSDEWKFRRDHLCKVAGIGRDKFARIMKELGDLGYVERVCHRVEGGKLGGTEWVIHDDPSDRGPENTSLGATEALKNRPPVEPTPGKSDHIRNNNLQEEQKEEETPKPPEGADDLFSAMNEPESDFSDEEAKDQIETGFEEFWNEIWPSHKRKIGKADCQKVYRQACEGKHSKAEKISPAELNRCARCYIKSVRDLEFLKGPLPWLRQPGWEPFVKQIEKYDWDDLTARQQAFLSDGRIPPSMMVDGQSNDAARYWMAKLHGWKEQVDA